MQLCKRFPCKLLLLLALLVAVPSGAALASRTYADTAGDAPPGAPDMTGVTISHLFAGDVTFRINFANRSTLAGDDGVVIMIDSDRNPATGESGLDYAIAVLGEMPNLAMVIKATDPEATPVLLPVKWLASKGMAFTVNKAAIGAPKTAFDFLAMSTGQLSAEDPPTEFVPHTATLTYSLAVRIAKVQLAKAVTSVRAGTVFSVRGATVRLSTGEVFKPTSLKARALIAGKVVKPRTGGLSWSIPKTARGKRLVVTLNATYRGLRATQQLTLRVR